MASLGNPRTWVPYMNNKDCSQGFCSFYCPQWCYVIYPPPPPPPLEFPNDDSSPNFSPLVIAIIGILASAFLLVTYYTIISKYCGRRESSQSEIHEDLTEENNHIIHNPSLHEPWQVSTAGLDESLIKSITSCKYKKGEGLVDVADCAVCLGEFRDGESIRLLPKCSHAFHVPCIDTWLKSHSNCPLCRAGIFVFNASLPSERIPSRNEISSHNQHEGENVLDVGRENELDVVGEEITNGGREREREREVAKTSSLRAFSDLGNLRHSMIEIVREEDYDDKSIQRSVSMDHSLQRGVLVYMNQEQDSQDERFSREVGSSSKMSTSRGESSKCSNNKRRVLHCVLSPISMKRSFSSGRFSVSRSGRVRQGILPL